MKDLAILITCHNRKEKTLKCLNTVFDANIPSFLKIDVLLFDDGSTDGTSESVKSKFPQVEILKGSGDLYWAGGMRRLISYAKTKGYDYYLWLNDDTYLFKDSIKKMLDQYLELQGNVILSGATKDPDSGKLTYGGFKRKFFWSPLHLELVKPNESSNLEVKTINGNCVLLSHDALIKVGNLDSHYTHGLADLDFGFEAGRKGVSLFLSKGFLAYCKRDKDKREEDLKQRINRKRSIKNMPVNEWKYYVKKNGGALWTYYFIAPYLKSLIFKS